MKILLVNKFFYPKGGTEIIMFEQERLLRNKGHQVAYFSMKDKRNQPSEYDKYFVSNVDLNKPIFSWFGIKTIFRMIYSFEAKRNFKMILKNFQPDLIHYHNIYHQISPSILKIGKKTGVPGVMTLHDYKLICPNYLLYNHFKQEVCEKCKKRKFYQPIIQKCFKNSRMAGAVIGFETAFHKFLKIYEKNIDLFIAPSEFTRKKFIEWGWDENKIKKLEHFIDKDRFAPKYEYKNYIIAYGRLELAKGYGELIETMRTLPDIKLKIIGSGTDEDKIKKMAKNMKNIEFIPHLGWSALIEEVHGARLVLNLSKYYETFGLTVLEAMALGKVVVCYGRGAIEELVLDEQTGIQIKQGDLDELRKKIKELFYNEKKLKEMGRAARLTVEQNFGSKNYYLKLMDIYNSLLHDSGEMG